MTESEGTSQSGGAPSSGGSSSATRKKSRARRTGGASKTRRKRTTRAAPARRKAGAGAARKTTRRRRTTAGGQRAKTTRRGSRSAKPAGLQGLLNDLARRASQAGSTIADLSEGGTDAARRTIGSVSETSRQTIARVRREWNRLDTSRRVEFVAGLLGALAAATAGVRSITRKK